MSLSPTYIKSKTKHSTKSSKEFVNEKRIQLINFALKVFFSLHCVLCALYHYYFVDFVYYEMDVKSG